MDAPEHDHLASATTDIAAPPSAVWAALVSPEASREYMFGAAVASDWAVGSPITFTGEWEGKPFVDHGVILQADAPRVLRYTHFSPLSGQPDVPENHHTLTYTLEPIDDGTRVTLTQDNNPTQQAADHSTGMWEQALAGLRSAAERGTGAS